METFSMSEAQWLESDDPIEMLLALHFAHDRPRKFALFAFATFRFMWKCLPDSVRTKVLEAEQAEAVNIDLTDKWGAFDQDMRRREIGMLCVRELQQYALYALHAGVTDLALHRRASNLVRDLFGNPFRVVEAQPSWFSPEVLACAASIYEEEAFDRMPVLANVLRGAGCTNHDLLNHCHQPGEHVRGCWLIDLILGES